MYDNDITDPADDLVHEPVNFLLDVLNLSFELLVLIGRDTGGNDWPSDATSPTEGSLGSDENVLHVLECLVRQAASSKSGIMRDLPSPHTARGDEEEFPEAQCPQSR